MEKENGVPKWSPTRYKNVHEWIDVLCNETMLMYMTDLGLCESPIEELFLTGIYHELSFFSSKGTHIRNSGNYMLKQQEAFKCGENTYRVDFHIIKFETYRGHKVGVQIIVECDGHEFHSDKEQINRDNQRDLDMLAYHNIPTIRFLGSELNENPFKCATRVVNVLDSLLEAKLSLIKKFDRESGNENES